MNTYIVALLLSIGVLSLNGQDRVKMLAFHAGFNVFPVESVHGSMNIRDFASGSISPDAYFYDGSLSATYTSAFAFLAGEVFSVNEKISFSSGLKYSRAISTIRKRRLYSDNDFFFYRLREDGTNTDYVTLKRIMQYSDYLGVPLEVRVFPFNARRIRFYVKAGAEINFNILRSGNMTFGDEAMEVYEQEIIDAFRPPSAISGMAYLAGGLRFGKPGKSVFGIEGTGPTVFLGSSAGLMKIVFGAGFQMYVSIPLTKPQSEKD